MTKTMIFRNALNAVCLSEEQARDEKFLAEKRMQNMISCIGCKGCPASKNYLS